MIAALTTAARIAPAHAEVDRVYHPYVEPLETELEWRSTVIDDKSEPHNGEQLHRLAVGRALSDRVFVEGYINARRTELQALQLSGFELEALYQLTEPGEYGADWAALFEFERDTDRNISSVSSGVVMEKEFGATSFTANVLAEYEYGAGVADKFEIESAGQWRWRWRESLEPALEYYAGDDNVGIGPVLTGLQRLGTRQKLKWEFGVILGIGAAAPAQTWRALLEFEF